MKIVTHYDPKPIPDRNFDWSALDEDTYGGDPGDFIGWGSTEEAAKADFMDQWMERECERDCQNAIRQARVWDELFGKLLGIKP